VTSRPTRITVLVERQPADEGLLADFGDAECAGLGVDARLRWPSACLMGRAEG
jgi:hypothetical protein